MQDRQESRNGALVSNSCFGKADFAYKFPYPLEDKIVQYAKNVLLKI